MLHSIELTLLAAEAGRARSTHGHHAHALFMDLVRKVDPELAQRLHDLNGEKPFTVSPLLELHAQGSTGTQLRAGERYRMRFTILSEELFGTMMRRFLAPGGSGSLVLGETRLEVERIDAGGAGGAWAAAIDEATLTGGAQVPHDEIRLEFVTPTAFSRGERPWGRSIDLLPSPNNVFESLARRWNTLVAGPRGLERIDQRRLGQFVAERVVVNRMERVQTRALQFGHGLQIGFTGIVGYLVQGTNGVWADNENMELARTLDWLADFAFYSGVGSKTTMGMGQTRRIKPVAAGARSDVQRQPAS